MKFIKYCIYIFLISVTYVNAQNVSDVYVDEAGIMRWPDKKEVYGFGVNYTVPFAHAYRTALKLGIDPKEAIDNDVYHFARLGFDAYRVHVWDTEISDSIGNLLNNEHLELFDYMLRKMKDRGMKFILTPIAFWGNGWPEPDDETPGFANKYGKGECLVNEDAIKAQEKYLYQFINHVNPHTGLAYKDDPDIIAFEVSNEPHHRQSPSLVTSYVKRMVAAMKNTGCQKPILYNISHSIDLVDAYYDAGIDGGTFQWYPTGLGAQEEIGGNLLPNVDSYNIPFKDNINFKQGAKIVYEFDAADVGRSYIYPAMARSFRKAGIQWATHFSYDPTYMAFANTEYNTHYMNLVYAPQKALSLKITSELFHQVPLYTDFGSYPANKEFGNFNVDYEKDLAEMVSEDKFFYTNTTSTVPPQPNKLKEIAGAGNSSLVQYEGTGAYFLDRIEKGVWRLEVLPDAIWVDNLFGRNRLDKTVAVINWREWLMSIDLENLGDDFTVKGINENNGHSVSAINKSFKIVPGTYVLTKKGKRTRVDFTSSYKNIKINEFTAPKTTLTKSYVVHSPLSELSVGSSNTIVASIITKQEPESVELWTRGYPYKVYKMEKTSGYDYSVTIPESEIVEGYFKYNILVREGEKTRTFPSGIKGKPFDWDFNDKKTYETRILSPSSKIYLFNAVTDFDLINLKWDPGVRLMPGTDPNNAELHINIKKLFTLDNENPNGDTINDYSIRYYFGDRVKERINDISKTRKLIIKGRSLNGKNCKVQVSLVTNDGFAFGGIFEFMPNQSEYQLDLSDLRPNKLVTLPRPYPTFLPYYFAPEGQGKLNMMDIESLQISIGPGIPQDQLDSKHGFAIESVRIE